MNKEMSLPGSSIPSATYSIVAKDTPPKKGWRMILGRAVDWLAYKDKSEWLNNMRGNISMAASIIATMTFQLATNPPGGVVQVSQYVDVVEVCRNISSNPAPIPCPGESVLAAIYPEQYVRFLASNTICFVASLSVCLLLVSGLPLSHRFPTWLLLIGMCITVTSLALTYLYGIILVTPTIAPVWDTAKKMFEKVLWTWIGLLVIVSFLHMIRLFVWCAEKCIKKRNRQQK
ncbi:uncharacterized protein LOC133304235 [Gastrolobium bilobum]|uniref:uncharacterized protein LOC133304235 n=1 Tax=Gastrolobium bilobum TaxID=150636 RepID=UPI002AB2ED93|nr:uncharacterized protein LOC133304235 [Gastrolobium bilobum]